MIINNNIIEDTITFHNDIRSVKESRCSFTTFKGNDKNPKNYDLEGIRCHNAITAFFLRILGKIKTIKTNDGETIYLNKGSFKKWKEWRSSQIEPRPEIAASVAEVITANEITAVFAKKKLMPESNLTDLYYKNLTETQVQNLFSLKARRARTFSLLSSSQADNIFEKLSKSQLMLIEAEQLDNPSLRKKLWARLHNIIKRDHKTFKDTKGIGKRIEECTRNDHIKNWFLADFAESYYDRGDYKNARKITTMISDYSIKNPLFMKLTEGFCEQGDYERAFKIIKKEPGFAFLREPTIKTSLLTKLVESFCEKGDNESAFRAINAFYIGIKAEHSLLAKLAENYCEKGDYENALKMIEKLYNDFSTKNPLFVKLAEKYREEGDYKEALKMILRIDHDSKARDSQFAKLAESYCEQDDGHESALEVTMMISDLNTRDSQFAKLAESYYKKGDYENTLKMIMMIKLDVETKDSQLAKLAESYCEQGDSKNARKMTMIIVHDGEAKDSLFAKLAESYCEQGDSENARKMAKKIVLDVETRASLLAKLEGKDK